MTCTRLALRCGSLTSNLLDYGARGTVEDTELIEGLVLEQKVSHIAGGVHRVEKAKIGLIQFCISPPKTDVRLASFGCVVGVGEGEEVLAN